MFDLRVGSHGGQLDVDVLADATDTGKHVGGREAVPLAELYRL